ncbi:MAG TPA: cupin domain-containing protein [Xanthobacteraceae bacterium]|nr:cupin domain-containing protein [Xanthobacteraceae bacterium]
MPNATVPFMVGAGENRSTRKLGGLSGTVICVKFSGADTDNQLAVLELPTAPGSGPPLHVHRIENEWFYVLEGEHEFQVASDRFRVTPGDSVFAPRLIPHGWRNVGARPGKMLCIATPAGRLEAFFEELSVLASSDPTNVSAKRAVFEKYDMEIVGPPLADHSRA